MAYTKKTWQKGEVIKATDLNNMETGIEAVTDEVGTIEEHFDSIKGLQFTRTGSIAPTIGNVNGAFISGASTSRNGINYKAEVTGGSGKIICGIAKSNNKDYQIALGQVALLTANQVQNFPWYSSYIDSENVMQSVVNGTASMVIGSSASNGAHSLVVGAMNVTDGNQNFALGQINHITSHVSAAIGEALEAKTRGQVCLCVANDNKEEDLLEVGNGNFSIQTFEISRSNAFRVTRTGSAIAQTSLGIEDGNGEVVSITAAQLQALLSNANPTCLVTMTYDSTNNRYVSDKTAGEVYAAYNAAKSVVFKFSDIGYVMWGGKAHAEAFCPNVRMLYNDNAAGLINDPKYIVDGYGPNDITLGIIAPTSADYFIMGVS